MYASLKPGGCISTKTEWLYTLSKYLWKVPTATRFFSKDMSSHVITPGHFDDFLTEDICDSF